MENVAAFRSKVKIFQNYTHLTTDAMFLE